MKNSLKLVASSRCSSHSLTLLTSQLLATADVMAVRRNLLVLDLPPLEELSKADATSSWLPPSDTPPFFRGAAAVVVVVVALAA